MKIVEITLEQARWLGNAVMIADVAGLIAVTDAGRDAAQAAGVDCIGIVPDAWDYPALSQEQLDAAKALLSRRVSGWSGAGAINADRCEVLTALNQDR